jgi:competence protein ComEC
VALLWLAIAWTCGIALGSSSQPSSVEWIVLGILALSAAAVFRRDRRSRLIFACACFTVAGALRCKSAQPNLGPGSLSVYNDTGHRVTLGGIIVAPPESRDTYTAIRVKVDSLSETDGGESRPVAGTVLIYADRLGEWSYGDAVQASGPLETPPIFDTFSYKDYLARQGVYSVMRMASVSRQATGRGNPVLGVVFSLRQGGLKTLHRLYPDPEASLLAGILLGIESEIPGPVEQSFNATGTTHIIAISGFNITIIASIFISALGRQFGARWGAIAAGLAIAVYTIFVGAGASVVRAALMAGLVLLARRLGRREDALASLAATAILMTLIHPNTLWDVGFQLSFAATLGLILYADPLQSWFTARFLWRLPKERAEKLGGLAGEFLLFTLAAQVTTLPLTALYFRRVSLVALLANPVILPAQPAVMILGGLSVIAGWMWLPLGKVLAWLTWPFVAFTIRSVEFFAQWPMAAINLGQLSLPVIFGFYLMLFGGTAVARLISGRQVQLAFLRPLGGTALVALAIGAGLAWKAAVDLPDGRLHLTLLDVGPGDAVLVESPTGRFALIDGGPSSIRLSDALGRRLPLFRRALDVVFVGGDSDDQLMGLSGISERFPMGALVLGAPPSTRAYSALVDDANRSSTSVTTVDAGAQIDLGGGAHIDVVAIGEHGSVVKVVLNNWRALIAPGADPALVAELLTRGDLSEVTVLLLPDGGFAGVNSTGWLEALKPQLALASVEAGNRRGLPSPTVLEALAGTTVLRTDVNGWIHISTDGEQMWTEVERAP